ncbi:MAG: InlB B-repeat-containing protein, partial [Clostridia bacterium]|nr:InlB B-repeat-containing protein [Clostridia bacterium]
PAQIEAIKATASKYDPNTQIADSVSFRIYINSVFPQTTTLKMTISELSTYTITYDANGGSFANSETQTSTDYNSGATYSMPTTPTKTECTFLGWATTSNATSPEWESGTKLANAQTTWYAVWQAYVELKVDLSTYGYYTSEYRMIIVATTDPDFSYECTYGHAGVPGSLSYTKGPNASQFFYLEPTLTTTENKEYNLQVPVGAKVLIGALNANYTDGAAGYNYYGDGPDMVNVILDNIVISASYKVSEFVSCIFFSMPSTSASVTFKMYASYTDPGNFGQ